MSLRRAQIVGYLSVRAADFFVRQVRKSLVTTYGQREFQLKRKKALKQYPTTNIYVW